MSSLKERLMRMRGISSPEKKEEEREETSSSFLFMDDEEGLDQEEVENEYGSFLRLRKIYPSHALHGRYALGELFRVAEGLRLLSPSYGGEMEDWLFFDTETTGLSAGAGNFPFLVGAAFFHQKRLVVDQYFLRDPSEEAAMLAELERLMAAHPHLVSYNGKSFDWPLLKNRWVLYRMNPKMEPKSHLDLLYPARSLWRGILSSLRLGEVEAERLGIRRVDDLPGQYAPIYYMNYLAEGNPAFLKGIFRHNRWDLLTLISLLIYLGKLIQQEESFLLLEEEELFRLGQWFDRIHLPHLAEAAFSDLLERPAAKRTPFLHAVAIYYKKKGAYEKAVSIWKESISTRAASYSLEPYIELAKYYEHQEKDYETALLLTEEAYAKTLSRRALLRGVEGEGAIRDLQKRISRLREKMARGNGNPSLFSGDYF